MKEEYWLRIRLFIKKKWPKLYEYHSHPLIGWDNCFLKEDTVARWKWNAKQKKNFDKGKGRHILCPGRPKGSKDVSGSDFKGG